MALTYATGYRKHEVTLDELRAEHGPHMEPEYARRLFAWLEHKQGLLGIGGGRRLVQPVKAGFAQPGKSFHQDQRFADGTVWYSAVDLVIRTAAGHSSGAIPLREVPVQGSAEAARWGLHINVGTPGKAGFEVWHLQAIEWDGFDGWVAAGRRRPVRNYPIPELHPTPPPDQEDDMVKAINREGKYWLWDRMSRTPVEYPGPTTAAGAGTTEGDLRLIAHLRSLRDVHGVKFAGEWNGVPVPFILADWDLATFDAAPAAAA